MMATFSSDTRFLQIKEMVLKREKEEGIRKIICHMLEHKKSPEDVSELTGEPVEYVYRIQKEYLALVREDKNYDTKKD